MTKRLLGLLICLIISKFNLSQDILLGDYVPGNGIVLTSTDNNYKVVLRGYSQSLFESRTISYDSYEIELSDDSFL